MFSFFYKRRWTYQKGKKVCHKFVRLIRPRLFSLLLGEEGRFTSAGGLKKKKGGTRRFFFSFDFGDAATSPISLQAWETGDKHLFHGRPISFLISPHRLSTATPRTTSCWLPRPNCIHSAQIRSLGCRHFSFASRVTNPAARCSSYRRNFQKINKNKIK